MSTSGHDVEKSPDGNSVDTYPAGVQTYAISDDNNRFDVASIDMVQRRLKQRHVQMIAIAGTLGTGLFLGSGQALSGAGPLGALFAYALVGTVAYSSLCSLGEMTSHAPISGTFPHFASRWVDPALGFAVGWNYFYTNVISVPVEVSGAQILITYWDSNPSHAGIYIGVICIFVSAINIFGVRYFGEAEFIFSLIKLTMITGLILLGIILDAEPGSGPGGGRLGFHYWNDPGVFNGAGLVSNIGLDRFLGILSVLIKAGFSFQGMEIVAIAASETENPRRNIAKAVRRVFYRICIFYILGVFVTGLLVPYNDSQLLQTAGTAADSPYVLAMTRAGIKTLPGIINAGIMTSAFSAANSFLFCSSRILYGLALRGQAPRIFAHCTDRGLPIAAVLFSAAFSFLSLMSISSGAETVFTWFVSLSTVGGFFSWGTINFTYLFFYRGMKAQGIDRKQLHYWSGLQPYLSIWGVTWCTILVLINGFEVFWNFTAAKFLTAYINIPLFIILYVYWKITKKTKVWDPKEMDFYTGIPTNEETESPEVPPRNFAEKVAATLF
ncbi:amino acid permease/ SLC12A domain-containing protein [Hygrophoropsis aurantiaca]|uniref:Amino acid permease/ SLC12A domain-containing protein n=1 Tax=Hygrophoropsis aurantiaca TaxID=72124 RepID=A0ACB8A9C3_9AGAM|nr:amino acid permease/ SLC12A domain-containing protein [Hygrophoropsis aurantiaca]